jgi:Gas vesicle protein G
MFILDSLMISGIRWVLETAVTAAEAEMNDDSVLREQLLEAEMRREMGEITDEEFRDIETDLLARIREIKERRDGGTGPIVFGQGDEEGAPEVQVEATVSGDFHEPAAADSGTVVEGPLLTTPPRKRRGRTTR